MRELRTPPGAGAPQADGPTLLALSALAYVLAVALHEHAGHGAACMLLGSRATELGAFYVQCDDGALSAAGVRLVALAGPAVSLALGLGALAVAGRVAPTARRAFYFAWLLGAIGLMSGIGYALFSGITGLGDLGVGADGALHDVSRPWLWRLLLTGAGMAGYHWLIGHLWRTLTPRLDGSGDPARAGARRMTRMSYLTGAAVYVLIGLLNPHGLEIVLISVLPSSMGATCGLLLMWQKHRRLPAPAGTGPGLGFARSAGWIAAAVVVTAAYAAVFGPTLRP